MIAMTFIGCGVLFLIGLFLLVIAWAHLWSAATFGGSTEWTPVIVCGLLGGGAAWVAIHYAPLTISLVHA